MPLCAVGQGRPLLFPGIRAGTLSATLCETQTGSFLWISGKS